MTKLLKDEFPEIFKEIDKEKTTDNIYLLSSLSKKKIWWKCSKNHSYKTQIYHRTISKSNCPYCANKKVLKGYNDLQTLYPELCNEWDYEKNLKDFNLKPDELTKSSHKKVWWKCNNNHSYQAELSSRTIKNTGCPYCSGRLPIKGINDLQTLFPDLCKEGNDNGWWDYERNELTPDQVTRASSRYAFWKCKNNHIWKAKIIHRTVSKSNCPYCTFQTSFGEQCIYYYLLPYNAKNRFKLDNMEIDIYLPNKSDKMMPIGIEFNGLYWHKNRIEQDKIKEQKLSTKIKMIYIMEENENKVIDNKIYFDCKHNYNLNLEWALNKLFKILNLDINVNIEHDELLIQNLINADKKERSLAFKFPELLKEWNYKKNTISPECVAASSSKYAWWKCSKGHEWKAKMVHRTLAKSKCPYCANKKVLKGYNDLQTLYPELCNEGNHKGWWDIEKNLKEFNLKPDEVTPGSHKKAWWKCNYGHSWLVAVASKALGKSGCLLCLKKGLRK